MLSFVIFPRITCSSY